MNKLKKVFESMKISTNNLKEFDNIILLTTLGNISDKSQNF